LIFITIVSTDFVIKNTSNYTEQLFVSFAATCTSNPPARNFLCPKQFEMLSTENRCHHYYHQNSLMCKLTHKHSHNFHCYCLNLVQCYQVLFRQMKQSSDLNWAVGSLFIYSYEWLIHKKCKWKFWHCNASSSWLTAGTELQKVKVCWKHEQQEYN
jgi:hypothetical protein